MIPTLTNEERLAALAKAAKLRADRANLRANLKSGTITYGDFMALADKGDEAARGTRVKQVISAMPGYSFAKTRDLMKKLGISENRRVRGLGARQLAALDELFVGAR